MQQIYEKTIVNGEVVINVKDGLLHLTIAHGAIHMNRSTIVNGIKMVKALSLLPTL